MRAVKAYYDGRVFVPVIPVAAVKNKAAIITILDHVDQRGDDKDYLQYAGALSDDRYAELADILKDTQRVDTNEW
jgi:hypothetical protein